MSMVWSYSSLDLFTTCGKWAYHKHVAKDIKPEPDTPEQAKGNADHKALELRLKEGRPLPPAPGFYEAACASIEAQAKKLDVPVLTEFKVGIRKDFTPTGFFAPDVDGRGVLDVALAGPRAAAIFDWKTGKVKEKPMQLELFALFGFAHWPSVETITTANIWLKVGKIGTPRTFHRADQGKIWASILPTLNAVRRAEETGDWRAKPSPLCGWCPVLSCPHNPRKS